MAPLVADGSARCRQKARALNVVFHFRSLGKRAGKATASFIYVISSMTVLFLMLTSVLLCFFFFDLRLLVYM